MEMPTKKKSGLSSDQKNDGSKSGKSATSSGSGSKSAPGKSGSVEERNSGKDGNKD